MGESADITVQSPEGAYGTIPASNRDAAIASGFRVVSADEYERAMREPSFSDAAKALGASALRGASVGISDSLIINAADTFGGRSAKDATRRELNYLRDEYPVISGGGEVGGFLLPLLASGGTALGVRGAVRGVGALARGVSAAGAATEAAVARALPASRLLQATVPVAARGAAESALLGVGHEVSEAALGDTELTAEHVLASAGHMALLGGGLGAALGIGGHATVRAIEKMAPRIATAAESMAVRAVGARPADISRIIRTQGEDALVGIGRTALDELPKISGKSFAQMMPEEMAEAAKTARQSVGERIGAMYSDLDAAAPSVRPRVDKIAEAIDADVIAPLERVPGMRDVAKGVRSYLDDFAEKAAGVDLQSPGGVSFSRLHEFRMALDDRIKWEASQPTIHTQQMKRVRAIIDTELKASGEKAAAEAGLPQWREELDTLGNKYRHLREIERIGSAEGARQAAAGMLSFGDQLVGVGSVLSGHPVAGVAAAVGRKLVREHGAQIAAAGLDRLAVLGGLRRVSDKSAATIRDAAKRFVTAAQEPAAQAIAVSEGHATAQPALTYEKAAEDVIEYASNPTRLMRDTADALAPIAEVAPSVAASIAVRTRTTAEFLQSKLPAGHMPLSGEITPQLAKPRVSESEQARFLEYVRAANHPMRIVEDMRHGRLTLEGAEALRVLYPKLYNQLSTAMTLELAKAKRPLRYDAKLQLRTLLQVETDPTLTRGFITHVQAAYAAKKTQARGMNRAAPRRPISISTHHMTPIHRLEQR